MKYPNLLANVKAIMDRYGWDQAELAHRVGTTQGSVSRWGNSQPRGIVLARLADLAGVSPTALVDEKITAFPKKGKPQLPSGPKLELAMIALLDSVGLGHLADEYAAPLARRLPSLLEEMQFPATSSGRDIAPPPGEHSPAHAKQRRGKRSSSSNEGSM